MSSASFIIPLRKHSPTLGSSRIWEKPFGFCFLSLLLFQGEFVIIDPKNF